MAENQLGPEWVDTVISQATLIGEDIVDCIKAQDWPDGLQEELYPLITAFEEGEEEVRDYLLNEDIWDLLNEWAPEDCYFGSHPGDGSLIGFWRIMDSWEPDPWTEKGDG